MFPNGAERICQTIDVNLSFPQRGAGGIGITYFVMCDWSVKNF